MPNVGRPSRACHVCRERRTKCDLKRPQCSPCLRKGKRCPGYRDELDVMFHTKTVASYRSDSGKEDERRSKTASGLSSGSSSSSDDRTVSTTVDDTDDDSINNIPELSKSITLNAYIPFRIPGTRRDQQLFHYYCATTSKQLSDYQSTSFWTDTVLQWSIHEPVIRRCMVAYSCSLQRFTPLGGEAALAREARYLLSLQEYNNALRLLRRYILGRDVPRVPIEVILTSIIVLYSVARSIGNFEDAHTHLRAASNILGSLIDEKSCQRTPLSLSSPATGGLQPLLNVFSKISLQATILDDFFLWKYLNDDRTQRYIGPPVAGQFRNAIEAQIALETIQARFFSFVVANQKFEFMSCPGSAPHELPVFVQESIATLERQLAFWRSSFKDVLGSAYELSSGDTRLARSHAALVSVQYWTLDALIKGIFQLQHRQAFSSKVTDQAKRILSSLQLNFVINAENNERRGSADNGSPQIAQFIFQPGVIPHLYVVLSQQRDLMIQKRAISLLKGAFPHEMECVFQVFDFLIVIGMEKKHRLQHHLPVDARVDAQVDQQRLFEILGANKG